MHLHQTKPFYNYRSHLPLILGGSTHVMQNVCWMRNQLLEKLEINSRKNHMEIGLKSGPQHPSMAILPFVSGVPLIFHLGQYTVAQLCELIYSRQIWFNTQQKINMR